MIVHIVECIVDRKSNLEYFSTYAECCERAAASLEIIPWGSKIKFRSEEISKEQFHNLMLKGNKI